MSESEQSYFEFATFMATMKSQERLAMEKYRRACKLGYNGGSFTSSLSLLAEIKVAHEAGVEHITDDAGRPIKIIIGTADSKQIDLFATVQLRLTMATNALEQELKHIRKQRSVGKLIDE